jgi:cystathionine beta-synthase
MTNVFDNILGLIGNTPMVRLNRVTNDIPATVYAKLESYNPDTPTKDRIAIHIIEPRRKRVPKARFYNCRNTSGNTGFSIAMVSIIKGYKCILAVSDKTKPEKIAYLKLWSYCICLPCQCTSRRSKILL